MKSEDVYIQCIYSHVKAVVKEYNEKLLKKLDEMEDKGLAPELMPIEEENKWYREMLIESAKEEGLEMGIEQGIEQGIERGLERGIEQGKNDIIKNMFIIVFVIFATFKYLCFCVPNIASKNSLYVLIL